MERKQVCRLIFMLELQYVGCSLNSELLSASFFHLSRDQIQNTLPSASDPIYLKHICLHMCVFGRYPQLRI